MVRLRQPDLPAILARDERRLLDAGPSDPGHRLPGSCGEFLRYHHQPPGTGYEADAHAHVRVDELHYPGPAAAGVPGHHGSPDPPHVRPLLRHPLLRAVGRWRSDPVATPLLDLWTSRGVHPDPAGLRHHLRSPPSLFAEAALRLCGYGVLGRVHRIPGIRGLEPSHVRHRDGADCGHLLCPDHNVDRDPHRGEDLQLDRHHVGWLAPVPYPDAVRYRL